MNENKFYQHVSSWIKSYHNPEALEWLHRFVNNCNESQEVKEQLHREIDAKKAFLQNEPLFQKVLDDHLLIDQDGHPKIFTTEFSAMAQLAVLRRKGYNVALKPGSVFYRIKLLTPAAAEQIA